MPRHPHGPLPHIDEDVRVQRYHDDKGHEVKHGPKHQVGVAVQGRHVGARPEATDTVPAYARNSAHDDRHRPNDHDDHHHAAIAHAGVQLHPENRDVALYGDGQKVSHRRGQASIDQALP